MPAVVLGALLLALLRAPAAASEWEPPEPSSAEYDWIRLTSDEWLKGDFEWLRDRKVSFDSDELDEQSLDFSDIAFFRLPRGHSFRTADRKIYRGTAEMRDGVVRVRTRDGTVEFPRDQLISIVQGEGRERDRWGTNLSLGLAARRGNTDQADITGSAKIRRESALTRLTVEYNGVLSSVNGSTTANSHRVANDFDVYLTKRLFLTPVFFEFFSDQFQNIEQRYTPGTGLGYEIVRRGWLEWDVTAGAAYQHTRYTTQGADNDVAALAGSELDFDFEAFDWDNQYRFQLVPTDLAKTSHHFESVLSFDIWGPLDLDVSLIWDRITKPRQNADGSRPRSDDVRLTVGLGLDF